MNDSPLTEQLEASLREALANVPELVDPNADLERMDQPQIVDERTRILNKAKGQLENLEDNDLARLVRCYSLLRRMGGSGPPATARKPNAARMAAALPDDLSDIPR